MNDMTTVRHPLNLIWIDLEMTGLDTETDAIIEIATLVTDKDLNVLAEGPVMAIRQPEAMLAGMDEWNTRQHGQSGLTERVRNSTTTLAEAEQATLAFLKQFLDERQSPMCGNSICQDRRFLARQMPSLEAFFHYRNLDVSSVKEIIRRWRPELIKGFNKQSSHLAMSDIKDSIAELTYYRDVFFIMEPERE
ncbi:MAG: oligoribonuclease [Porticoccus sp.]|jgi:oligoribonuclease|uniref:oligoribonuclease n=2 Tax=Porticoccus sp. TaxID=2024853 RepID=UPI0039E31DBB|tara:strand:- start:136785 stop:137360 length:576 start_codon:yes stop_codon:yes gene_type:complete